VKPLPNTAAARRSLASTGALRALPADLDIIPAALIRQRIPETTLWRLEKSGELLALRIGSRRFYRLSDWERFLNRSAKRGPIAVPWREHKSDDKNVEP
jgi:DNA-binding transcriptional regulator PaaX